MNAIFGTETGAVDYLLCDIFVRANAGSRNDWKAVQDAAKLRVWVAKLFAFFYARTEGFVWNRECPKLIANPENKVPCVSGQMTHGDAVDDEWLVVWLLREATKEYPELVVSVCDADGQFLLAEAAMHIPRWLTPENSQNRVFIHRGRLHIVPLSVSSGKSFSEQISLTVALGAVVNSASPTLAPPSAERAAFSRLEEYPAKVDQSLHRARCKLPVLVARALALRPQLIAAATELFYARDALQIKACQKMTKFAPEPSVLTTVVFNRVQYAKLASQNIRAPAIFNLPPVQSPEYKASVLGMKVACGFEMLNYEGIRTAAQKDPPTCASQNNSKQETSFASFLELLGGTSYQGGLPVTSDAYAQRRAYAEQVFEETQGRDAGVPAPAGALVSLASQSLSAALALAAEGGCALPEASGAVISGEGEDEDDSWLALDPDQLDAVMRKAESVLKDSSQAEQDDEPAENWRSDQAEGSKHAGDSEALNAGLQQVLEKFEAFLAADSGLEGAELLNDLPSNGDDNDEDIEGSDEDVDWDADEVIYALMKAVGADDLGDTTEADNAHEDYSSAANPEEFKVDEDALDDSHAGSHLSQDDHLAEMMHAMDQELSKTHIGKSFASSERECGDGYDDPDVNVDLNLVESIVESFRAQEGLAGPAGTMLKQFGIHLPPNDSDVDSDEETG